MKVSLTVFALLIGLTGRCDVPVVSVGSKVLTTDDLAATAARNGYAICDTNTAQRAIEETVDFELLACEAEKLGLFNDPDIRRTVQSMAVQKLIATKVNPVHPPELLTEDQLAAYYTNNLAEFTRPAITKGRVLMVRRDRKDAGAKATRVNAAIKKGKNFAELVRLETDDPSARVNGGVTPWLVEARENRKFPATVVTALFSGLKVQQVSPQIETPEAWYWIQLLELRSGSVTSYDQAKRTISRKLAERERLTAYGAFVKGLKGQTKVVVDPNAVSNLLKDVKASSLPPRGPVSVKARK